MFGSFNFHIPLKKPGLLCGADRAIFVIVNVLFVFTSKHTFSAGIVPYSTPMTLLPCIAQQTL